MTEELWQAGDLVSLVPRSGPARLVRLAAGPVRVGDDAVLDLAAQIGQPVGGRLVWLGEPYLLVRPSLADLLATARRGAQVILPKDAMPLLWLAGVGPGLRVAEAGSGSGAMTTVLAHFVGPLGRVVSFDRRPEHQEVAAANVRHAGYGDRVDFIVRDVAAEGFGPGAFASVVLDLPEPWTVLKAVHEGLLHGGYVATYSPTYNQLERTVRSLREFGFGEVRSLEVLERGLHVGEGGTRPEFDMRGHTGFLAGGRRVD